MSAIDNARAASVLALSARIGLSEQTCDEMLRKGWSYREEVGETRTWVDPSAQLPIHTVCPQEEGK